MVDATAATTAIADTVDTSTVTLTATGAVAEGGNITYTATVDNAPSGSDLVLDLDNGSQITILAGSTTGNVTVAAPTDDAFVDAGNVTVAITGASGFLGRSLAAFLETGGHRVIRMVRERTPFGSPDVYWDYRRESIDLERLEGVDAVVHLAARAGVDRPDRGHARRAGGPRPRGARHEPARGLEGREEAARGRRGGFRAAGSR